MAKSSIVCPVLVANLELTQRQVARILSEGKWTKDEMKEIIRAALNLRDELNKFLDE